MLESCDVEIFQNDAMNQQVDSKMPRFGYSCHTFSVFRFTCRKCLKRIDDSQQKAGKPQCSKWHTVHYVFFMFVLNRTVGVCMCSKTKIRLKCLHSDEHPFLWWKYHRVFPHTHRERNTLIQAHRLAGRQHKSIRLLLCQPASKWSSECACIYTNGIYTRI